MRLKVFPSERLGTTARFILGARVAPSPVLLENTVAENFGSNLWFPNQKRKGKRMQNN